jgi:hypothetical protein
MMFISGLCEMPWAGKFGLMCRSMACNWLQVSLETRHADIGYLYALALGMYGYAAVPRPLGSSLMPLRRTYRASGQPIGGFAHSKTAMLAGDHVCCLANPPRLQDQAGGVLSAAA